MMTGPSTATSSFTTVCLTLLLSFPQWASALTRRQWKSSLRKAAVRTDASTPSTRLYLPASFPTPSAEASDKAECVFSSFARRILAKCNLLIGMRKLWNIANSMVWSCFDLINAKGQSVSVVLFCLYRFGGYKPLLLVGEVARRNREGEVNCNS